MNKKYQILRKGPEFSDNYGRNKNSIIGVKINGRYIEKLLQNGKWLQGDIAPKEPKTLLWTQNGRIVALFDDREPYETSVYLTPTPNKYLASEYIAEYTTGSEDSVKPSAKKVRSESNDDDRNWLWTGIKFIFKAIWWLIKGVFCVALLAMASDDNKK